MNKIYLIQTRESIKCNENIYKIGKTTQCDNKRFMQYPKGSNQPLQIDVDDCHLFEKQIIKIFDIKFKQIKEYGREYYEGDKDEMIDTIMKIRSEYNINKKFNVEPLNVCKFKHDSSDIIDNSVMFYYPREELNELDDIFKQIITIHNKQFNEILIIPDKWNDTIIEIIFSILVNLIENKKQYNLENELNEIENKLIKIKKSIKYDIIEFKLVDRIICDYDKKGIDEYIISLGLGIFDIETQDIKPEYMDDINKIKQNIIEKNIMPITREQFMDDNFSDIINKIFSKYYNGNKKIISLTKNMQNIIVNKIKEKVNYDIVVLDNKYIGIKYQKHLFGRLITNIDNLKNTIKEDLIGWIEAEYDTDLCYNYILDINFSIDSIVDKIEYLKDNNYDELYENKINFEYIDNEIIAIPCSIYMHEQLLKKIIINNNNNNNKFKKNIMLDSITYKTIIENNKCFIKFFTKKIYYKHSIRYDKNDSIEEICVDFLNKKITDDIIIYDRYNGYINDKRSHYVCNKKINNINEYDELLKSCMGKTHIFKKFCKSVLIECKKMCVVINHDIRYKYNCIETLKWALYKISNNTLSIDIDNTHSLSLEDISDLKHGVNYISIRIEYYHNLKYLKIMIEKILKYDNVNIVIHNHTNKYLKYDEIDFVNVEILQNNGYIIDNDKRNIEVENYFETQLPVFLDWVMDCDLIKPFL
jgi:hypothetical protein